MLRVPLDEEDCFTFSEVDAMHKQAVWEIMWALVLTEEEPACPGRLLIESSFDEHVGGGADDRKRDRGSEEEENETKRQMLALVAGGSRPGEIVRTADVNNVAQPRPAGEVLANVPLEIFEKVFSESVNVNVLRGLVNVNSTRATVQNAYSVMARSANIPADVRKALLSPHAYVRLANRDSSDSDIDAAKASADVSRKLYVLNNPLYKVGFGRLPYEDKVAILKLRGKPPTLKMMNMLVAEAGRENFNYFDKLGYDDYFALIYREMTLFEFRLYEEKYQMDQEGSGYSKRSFFMTKKGSDQEKYMKNLPRQDFPNYVYLLFKNAPSMEGYAFYQNAKKRLDNVFNPNWGKRLQVPYKK